MKRSLLLGLVSLWLCGGIAYGQNIHGLTKFKLSATTSKDLIDFTLVNKFSGDAVIETPVLITLDGSISGVEYVVRNSLGVRFNLCAHIDPLAAPKSTSVPKRQSVTFSLRLDYIRSIYCVDPGRYKLTAIFHHTIGGLIEGPDLVSEDFYLDVSTGGTVSFVDQSTRKQGDATR